ncbi:MAG: Hsp20/alpha crystallin family protein [Anaerolineae bacterium]
MANIVRWNPMREMAAMQSAMDRIFDQWRPMFDDSLSTEFNRLAIDLHEDDKNYVVTTELPGVKADNIHVRHENDMLVIDAEIPEVTEERKEQRALIKERRYGHYMRRIQLPTNVNYDAVDATYENGVLTLTLPKSPETQPRTITVKAGGNGHKQMQS